jgi:hypothetical protein
VPPAEKNGLPVAGSTDSGSHLPVLVHVEAMELAGVHVHVLDVSFVAIGTS